MVGIFSDRVPVNESESALPIVGVKTDSDAVAIGLVWNFECPWRPKLELQLESLATNPWRFVG